MLIPRGSNVDRTIIPPRGSNVDRNIILGRESNVDRTIIPPRGSNVDRNIILGRESNVDRNIFLGRESNVDRSIFRGGGEGQKKCIAVAIDKDKTSQHALKWALDNLVTSKDDIVKLIHVKERQPTTVQRDDPLMEQQIDSNTIELFLPFRCFCRRRLVQCETIVLEDQDVARAITDYVCQNGIDTLLLGAASKNGLSRLFNKTADVQNNVIKWAPDFCTIYIISKGKVSNVRNATRAPPLISSSPAGMPPLPDSVPHNIQSFYDEMSASDIDPVTSSGRPSTDSNFFHFDENLGSDLNKEQSPRRSNLNMFESSFSSGFRNQSLFADSDNGLDARISWSSNNMEEYEEEMRRLKTELKQTIDMYHAACKEALAAKQKAAELEEWKRKLEKRLKEAHTEEENELAMAESEKTKSKSAIVAAEAVQKLIEVQVQKRVDAEMKALRDTERKRKVLNALAQSHVVLKYQSLLHMLIVFFLFYFYFSLSKP